MAARMRRLLQGKAGSPPPDWTRDREERVGFARTLRGAALLGALPPAHPVLHGERSRTGPAGDEAVERVGGAEERASRAERRPAAVVEHPQGVDRGRGCPAAEASAERGPDR